MHKFKADTILLYWLTETIRHDSEWSLHLYSRDMYFHRMYLLQWPFMWCVQRLKLQWVWPASLHGAEMDWWTCWLLTDGEYTYFPLSCCTQQLTQKYVILFNAVYFLLNSFVLLTRQVPELLVFFSHRHRV